MYRGSRTQAEQRSRYGVRDWIDARTKQPQQSIAVLGDIFNSPWVDRSLAAEHNRAQHFRSIGRSNRRDAPEANARPGERNSRDDQGAPEQHGVEGSITTPAGNRRERSGAARWPSASGSWDR